MFKLPMRLLTKVASSLLYLSKDLSVVVKKGVAKSYGIKTNIYSINGDHSYMFGTLPHSPRNINLKITLLHYTLCANYM
jgi:hypothetical protein